MPKAALTPRMISDFCRLRLVDVLEESERSAVGRYLTDLLELLAFPPYRGRWIDWAEVAIAAGIEKERLQGVRHGLQPVFDAVSRAVAMQEVAPALRTPPKDMASADRPVVQTGRSRRTESSPTEATTQRKRGPKPKVIVEYAIHEPTEMGEDNKELFRRILRDFITRFEFALPGDVAAQPVIPAPAPAPEEAPAQ